MQKQTAAYERWHLKSSPDRAPWWLQVCFLSLVVYPWEPKLLWTVATGLECFWWMRICGVTLHEHESRYCCISQFSKHWSERIEALNTIMRYETLLLGKWHLRAEHLIILLIFRQGADGTVPENTQLRAEQCTMLCPLIYQREIPTMDILQHC